MSDVAADSLQGHIPVEHNENEDMDTSSWTEVGKRKRSLNIEDEDRSVIRPRRPAAAPLIQGSSRASSELAPSGSTDRIPSEGKGNTVIIMKSTENNAIFTKPSKVTELLNNSPFGKYIIEDSVFMLGRGVGCKFEILDLNKLEVDLSDIKKLGSYDVRCWVPKSVRDDPLHIHYGKIGPIDVEEDINDIKKGIRIIGNNSAVIMDVLRVPSRKENEGQFTEVPSQIVKIKFRGDLPNRVAIGHSVYQVSPWIPKVARCFNCWRFGHGQLSCKATVRCARCSHNHKSKDCSNDPFCYFCGGSHAIRYNQCPVFQKALKISREHAGEIEGAKSPLTLELQKLNPREKQTPQITRPITKQSFSQSKINHPSSKPGSSKKTFAEVLADLSDTDLEISDEEDTMSETSNLSKNVHNISTKSKKRGQNNSRYFHDSALKNVLEDPTTQSLEAQNEIHKKQRHKRPPKQEIDFSFSELGIDFMKKIFIIGQKFFNSYTLHKSFSAALFSVCGDIFALVTSFMDHYGQ